MSFTKSLFPGTGKANPAMTRLLPDTGHSPRADTPAMDLITNLMANCKVEEAPNFEGATNKQCLVMEEKG